MNEPNDLCKFIIKNLRVMPYKTRELLELAHYSGRDVDLSDVKLALKALLADRQIQQMAVSKETGHLVADSGLAIKMSTHFKLTPKGTTTSSGWEAGSHIAAANKAIMGHNDQAIDLAKKMEGMARNLRATGRATDSAQADEIDRAISIIYSAIYG